MNDRTTELDARIGRLTNTRSLVDIADLDTAERVDLTQFIERELRLVIQDRNRMRSRYRANDPWLVCAYCGRAVQLVSHLDRSFYFRHMPEEEDRGCPVVTKGRFSPDEINAMQYNGAKESAAHRRLKEILRDSIQSDSRFEQTLVERVWRGMDRTKWRKPDVRTKWGEHRFAFEIQLSTTFLSVIVDRREFYRSESAHLIWVFQRFDPERTRRAEEDVFFNNNSNVFIVNEDTLERSRRAGRLVLVCCYAVPQLVDGSVKDVWERKEVFIDDLTLDSQRQQAYFFNYDAARAAIDQRLADAASERLRDAFEQFWRTHARTYNQAAKEEWARLRDDFRTIGIDLPEHHDSIPFSGVVSIMLSAKHGKPIGYGNRSLIEITNIAFNHYKPYLYLFGWALKDYGQEELLEVQDKHKTWSDRRELIRDAMKTRDPEYTRQTDFDPLIFFLLPRLRARGNESRA